jgi:hypothetical protein
LSSYDVRLLSDELIGYCSILTIEGVDVEYEVSGANLFIHMRS